MMHNNVVGSDNRSMIDMRDEKQFDLSMAFR